MLSFWLQTATNFAVFRSFITQNTAQYQQLFYSNRRAIFPKTVFNLKDYSAVQSYIHAVHYVLTI